MMDCKVGLERGGACSAQAAEEDVGVGRHDIYVGHGRERISHSLSLPHESLHVEAVVGTVGKEVETCILSWLIDRPRHSLAADAGEERGGSCEIAQSQSRHGIGLRHGVQHQHIG